MDFSAGESPVGSERVNRARGWAGITGVALVAMLTSPCTGPEGEAMMQADLKLINGWIVTMDGDRRVLQPGTVVIDCDRIAAVGGPELARRVTAKRTIDVAGDIVMPGMVNTHTHVSMAVFRGLADDRCSGPPTSGR